MKKGLCIIIALLMVVAICSCGKKEETPASKPIASSETENETGKTVESEPPADEEPEYEVVNIGDTISLDFATIKLEKLEVADDGIVEKEGNNSYSYNKGHTMVYLKGTIKNLYKTYLRPYPSNSYVKMIFDDKYECYGSIEARSDSFEGLAPLESNSIYIYGETSKGINESFSKVKIIFGFTTNFESPEIYSFQNFDKCDYIYQIEVNK